MFSLPAAHLWVALGWGKSYAFPTLLPCFLFFLSQISFKINGVIYN
jgi:hypothetical protein